MLSVMAWMGLERTVRLRSGVILCAMTLSDFGYAHDSDSSAAPGQTEIHWQAPAECPSQNSVRLAVERLLGASLEGLPSKDVQASGEVRRNDAGNWELLSSLSVGGQEERETLIAKKCQALADAMALKVALAIDPLAVAASVEPTPPAPPPRPAPAPSPDSQQHESPRRTPLGLRVTGGTELGPLPGITFGAGLYGSLQFPGVRLELGAQGYSGGIARYAEPSSVGAHFQLFSGTARACLSPGVATLAVHLCGGLELGVIRGEGFGTAQAESTSGLWGAAELGPALRLRLSNAIALWLEGDALLTVLRPEFHVKNLDTLYTPPLGNLRLVAGLEINFGD
ncbi:MAG TPA: hypothetical protein VHW01_21440 [Polyangiaceae bacterium]|jgi:hypothetical protein|nr:hypothetical protein [Polyangiaceae bacterium]